MPLHRNIEKRREMMQMDMYGSTHCMDQTSQPRRALAEQGYERDHPGTQPCTHDDNSSYRTASRRTNEHTHTAPPHKHQSSTVRRRKHALLLTASLMAV